MGNFKYLIFDVDDTLLDFGAAYGIAQKRIAKKINVPLSDAFKALDNQCGWKAWIENGLDDTDKKEVQQQYHQLYDRYILDHYRYLAQELNISADANELAQVYIDSVSSSMDFMEQDSLYVYADLSKNYKMILATNGIAHIQKARISAFIPYTYKTYISEEMGCIKPTRDYYLYVMQDLNCSPTECLMIGDSITNDMIGAKSVGMTVCYYNRKKKAIPNTVSVDFEISCIRELVPMLL